LNPDTPVITGVGAVSPFGVGRAAYFRGLKAALPATGPITRFDSSSLKSRVVAEARDFDPADHVHPDELKRVPRVVPMAIAAAREAFAEAGVDLAGLSLESRRKTAVIVGTGAGGIDFAEAQYAHFFGGEYKKATPYAVSSSFVGMLSSEISIALGLRGASHVLSTGCTSSTDAIGYAARLVRSGAVERVLTGGAEACITPGILAGFDRMKVTSTAFNAEPLRASRPFDRDRDGFVLGEGAWMFVLESYRSAREAGRRIYAAVGGYGSTCEAYHRVKVEPSGEEAARALQEALADGGTACEEVDYVNLHGTATEMNDVVETLALKRLFGARAPRVATSATKSLIGHPQGASGAAGVAAILYAMETGEIPPTANLENPDPRCDLDYTPRHAARREVRIALANCLAFGSKNSALLLRRTDVA